jgi:DNA mismatch endonuclease, patch repair protein
VLGGKRAIFVHGCFWHAHDCPKGSVYGADAAEWSEKQVRNVAHDLENEAALVAQGWRLLVVWECDTKDFGRIQERIRAWISG